MNHISIEGRIAGINAHDGKEWTASPHAQGKSFAVQFTVAPSRQAGDPSFWEQVASSVEAMDSRVQFVGLCLTQAFCAAPGVQSGEITYLTSMDPLQMHDLASAARRDLALLYRIGSAFDNSQALDSGMVPVGRFFKQLPISNNSQTFANQLLGVLGEKDQK
jgi:hypothetical protein